MRARFLRGLILALSSLSLVAAFSLTNMSAAQAVPYCAASGRANTPQLYNSTGSNGSVKVHIVGYGDYTIARGATAGGCPDKYYVPLGDDVKVNGSNGGQVIGCATGWHTFGTVASKNGGSSVITFTRKDYC